MKKNWTRFLPIGIYLLLAGAAHAFSDGNTGSFLNPEARFFHGGNGGGHIQELNTNHTLYQICMNDLEGYSEMLSGSEFFSYPSLRDDINTSMIARATTGEMGFEFLTGKVPLDYPEPQATFLWLSDLDLNQRQPFDIHLNGQLLLTFHANEDGTLTVTDNPGDARPEFLLIRRDANGDGIGAFRLAIPTRLLEKGARARLRFVGHKKNANAWIMIFKATDVIKRLEKSVHTEAAFEIREREGRLLVDAPAHFDGQSAYLISDGRKSAARPFIAAGDLAKAAFQLPPPKTSFSIVYGEEAIELTFERGDGVSTNTDLEGSFLFHHKAHYAEGWRASLAKLYRPDFFEVYSDFFDRKYEKGQVSLMNSSHQDIAWVDRPEVCIILRDTLLLTPVLRDAFLREDYGFDIEDGLMLREYLDRHPESKEKLATLLNRKLISVGATYNCPYEDMYDAEDQVRQLYLGKKWVKKTFGGYDSKVYWNVDVPGKSLQTPQILKKAGVDYMVISRHAKGMFHWASPDGSSVFTYSPGHYGNDLLYLSKSMDQQLKYGASQVRYWAGHFEESAVQAPLLSSQDMLPAIDYTDLIRNWNGFDSLKRADGEPQPVYLPDMELMTMDEFMPRAAQMATKVDTIMGERPNVWVYIHGPGHREALTASREASKLLPAAEKFYTIANLLSPEQMPYPYGPLDEAWQAKIYPDHGWGGHDGDITDNLFKENLVKSRVIGEQLLRESTAFIARHIQTRQSQGVPVVLFNSLSWPRTDPVTVNIQFVKGQFRQIAVFSADGQEVAAQTHNEAYHDDGSLKNAALTFIAEEVPAVGYATYYLRDEKPAAGGMPQTVSTSVYENAFYRVEFGPGGLQQVQDKVLGRDLFDSARFKPGEVFTLQSVGNGAGEFGDIQQPEPIGFDQVSAHGAEWEVVENGPVYTRYRLEQQIRDAVVRQEVTLYHQLKRLYFDTALRNWSGALFREFRTAFPLKMDEAEVAHEVPFGRVRVGKDEIKTAGERYTPLCKDVRPRAIIDWIAATDEELTVTLSSSVAAADWVDPVGQNDGRPLLQHLLLASRVSCHGEGNEYTQAGHHDFHHVLTSNTAGSLEGQRVAKQKNEPLQAVFYPDRSAGASLPEKQGFFSVDAENVIVSAIKKAEDSGHVILRMYELDGKDTEARVGSFFKIRALEHTNIIEEHPQPTGPGLKLGKYAIETFRLSLER